MYRVEELALAAGVSVEALRSYQSKGLLPAPRHEGRVAVYDEHHLERLGTIRDLKHRGFSLKAIGELLRGEGRPAAGIAPLSPVEDATLTLREVAERSGVPTAMLRSLEASGILRPRRVGEDWRYTAADVRAVEVLLALLGSGLPMEEFMAVASRQIETVEEVAHGAVDLFLRYARDPLLRREGWSAEQEAAQLVAAFRVMLDATTTLLAYNFRRVVLNAALAEIERIGTDAERAAMRDETRAHLEQVVEEAAEQAADRAVDA